MSKPGVPQLGERFIDKRYHLHCTITFNKLSVNSKGTTLFQFTGTDGQDYEYLTYLPADYFCQQRALSTIVPE